MARFSVDGAVEPAAKRRKKVPGASEKIQSSVSGLAKGSYSQNHEATAQSEEQVSEDVESEEEGDEEEEESQEGGGDAGSSNGNGTVVRIDTDVLDCPICYDAMLPPIYQCQNGHVVCSHCRVTICGKCPVCSEHIGLIRCLALERVVESVKLRCINTKYGCDAILPYGQRETHQKTCNYAPCKCPDSSCSFQGTTRSLSLHLRGHHKKYAVEFRYGCPFPVAIYRSETPFLVLIGSDSRLFLLLNKNNATGGNGLSMVCICSSAGDHNFVYELSVGDDATNLKLKSSAEVTREWNSVYPAKVFLLVPKDFFAFSHKIIVNVSVQKIKLPPKSAAGNHA